jgi:hypothetical protein
MSETCTAEVGLLKKHPCGEAAVAHCANCEQPLCTKHAVAQLSPSGARTGKFMCAPCHAANKAYEKSEAAAAAHKPTPPRPAAAPKPAAAVPAAPAAAPKPAAAQKKPEPPQEDSGPLEFTPSKKPDDKK